MASPTDCTQAAVTRVQNDGDVSTSKQLLQNVDNRLATLSEKTNLCDNILNDLKDLRNVLGRKSLRDGCLPPQD